MISSPSNGILLTFFLPAYRFWYVLINGLERTIVWIANSPFIPSNFGESTWMLCFFVVLCNIIEYGFSVSLWSLSVFPWTHKCACWQANMQTLYPLNQIVIFFCILERISTNFFCTTRVPLKNPIKILCIYSETFLNHSRLVKVLHVFPSPTFLHLRPRSSATSLRPDLRAHLPSIIIALPWSV